MDAVLLRTTVSDSEPQVGMLLINGQPKFLTLELPYRNNEHNISCIPLGKYKAKKVHSARFGTTFEITGVPNRDAILIHPGNDEKDTQGCVLIGERLVDSNFISGSRTAFQRFMESNLQVSDFNIEIIKWQKKC